VLGGICLLARTFRRVIVEGSSMEPTLVAGDRLLFSPLRRPRRGDIVAVPDPRQPRRLLVKRVTAVDDGQGLISVRGDNPDASTDSRDFGPVERRRVLGRAVYRYAPIERAGPFGKAGERYHRR
jgi:nickel-type superoxide dismutase maturation protease